MGVHTFTCAHCKREKRHESDLTTGYATVAADGWQGHRKGARICFDCCGVLDALDLEQMQPGERTILYLTRGPLLGRHSVPVYDLISGKAINPPDDWYTWEVSNWPGTLKIRCRAFWMGRHNIAGVRRDVYFQHAGAWFWGVCFGNWTQITHCQKLKRPPRYL